MSSSKGKLKSGSIMDIPVYVGERPKLGLRIILVGSELIWAQRLKHEISSESKSGLILLSTLHDHCREVWKALVQDLLFNSVFIKVWRRFRLLLFRICQQVLVVEHLGGVGRPGPALRVLLPKFLPLPGIATTIWSKFLNLTTSIQDTKTRRKNYQNFKL